MPETNIALQRQPEDPPAIFERSAYSLAIEHYDAEIPEFVEHALQTVYGNLHSSISHFRVHGGLENASTFILRKDGDIVAVFLFRIDGKQVQVLNEGMEIDELAAAQFAEFVFQRYEFIEFVSFNGVAHSIKDLTFPFSQCFCTDDSVISLPDSSEAYLQSLGKSTRKNIKQYLSRLQRDYPTFQFCVHDGRTVDEKLIRGIVSFNRKRFDKKGKVSAITELDEQRIIRMIRECGIVGTVSIDGKLCGGSLVYCIGEHYHSWLKAHDPAFDEYRLGLVGSFLMVSECIRRGGKKFHLMWGREPHKALLNSKLVVFFNLNIYRNHAAVLRNCGVLLRQVYQHGMRQGKLWILDMEKNPDRMPFPIKAGLNGVRNIKSWISYRK